MMEEVSCTISPLKLVYLSGTTKSGCAVIDITIPSSSGTKISKMQFRNNYTASISIKGKVLGCDDFKTILGHHQLMKSPHYANDSQNICKIDFSTNEFAGDSFTLLRIILRQPSSMWQRFSIENIKVYKATNNNRSGDEAKEIKGKEKIKDDNLKEFDSVTDNIVENLQNLFDQIKQVQNYHLEFDPSPFDVDGCYDINLLSYS